MSNKTTFQEKNTRLNTNNTDLSTILNTINNLPSASGGITPTGELSITENGTYDVTNYASALVNVASGGGSLSNSGTFTLESGLTEYTFDCGIDSPDLFIVFSENFMVAGEISTVGWIKAPIQKANCCCSMKSETSTSVVVAWGNSNCFAVTGSNIKIKRYLTYPLRAGGYSWVAIKL